MANEQYKILKFLVSKQGETNIAILLNELTSGLENNELVRERNNLALAIMNMADNNPRYITTNFSAHSDLSKYFDTRLWAQQKENEFGLSDEDMKIAITEDGMIKLQTLKELFDPIQKQPTYSAVFNEKFVGNFSQGNTGVLKQNKNESEESKELAKEQ